MVFRFIDVTFHFRGGSKIQKHKIEAAKKGFDKICQSFKPDVVWARSSAMGLGIIEAKP